MQLNPEDLPKHRYVLLDRLGHHDLAPFIRTYLKKRTIYSMLYYLCNLMIVGLTAYLFLQGYHASGYDAGNRFTFFANGIAIAFALVPLHEYIHVLAYQSQGATQTSYNVNWKKFYFMALANKFVANKKEFQVVALAPFAVITSLLVVLFFLLPTTYQLTVAGCLLAHTAMCSGDFGLLSYFQFHKRMEVVTYDDVENNLSYFYGRDLN